MIETDTILPHFLSNQPISLPLKYIYIYIYIYKLKEASGRTTSDDLKSKKI